MTPRFSALFILLASSVHGAGVCLCPPSISALINGTDYSNSFTITPILGGQEAYNISGIISNGTFTLSLNVTTHPDPDIDFGMSIGGDPNVSIFISQPYVGGPFPTIFSSSSTTVADLNRDGHASLLGSPFIHTTYVD